MNFPIDLTITLPLVFSVAAFVFAWFRTRRKDLEERLKVGAERMDRHETRLQRLEQTVQGMPAQGDMHRLQLQLAEMAGDLKAMAAAMEGNTKIMLRLETIVGRHEDHLLDGGKR